ncbi:FAD/NAD(P)-binding domain-containing protein [Pyrenochaeta sp. DS3sAY3a]|nr:FAD/NAD(P)-binding domain-containing protein [Pyrenochaeta sp. DS3sAY3a]
MAISDSPSTYPLHPGNDRKQRPIHVVVAGAGPSGLALAIELQKIPTITFQLYEKNSEVGGTWLENRYPGAACDVAAHAYQYTFESKKDWTSHFAPAEEIGQYFIDVAKKYALYQHIQFDSKVTNAVWDENSAQWTLLVSSSANTNGVPVSADVFVNAGGILNDWSWPDIEGLKTFEGKTIHTASWDKNFDWSDKRIAVIGSGATSIQIVPQMQETAKSIEVYVRSPTYIIPRVGFGIESSTFNEPYQDNEIKRFEDDPIHYKAFRKRIEQQMNENFLGSVKNSRAQKDGRLWAENLMTESIKSEELREKLIPKWELGCRRLTPGLPYLNAVQQANVRVERNAIARVTREGIETVDGVMHTLDAIVCATGFNTNFSARYDIIGRNQKNLRKLWKQTLPQGYMGLCVSGFPNYFTVLGPNFPIANGSLIPCIEYSAKYIIQALHKMQSEQIRILDVKQSIQDAFNEHAQQVHEDLVWTGSCQSWYKDRATGRVTAVWPGSSIHYMEMIETPRWEDYQITYCNSNPFRFMGNGVSQREANARDLAFYLDDTEDGPRA